jgi:hypothetical protein
LKQRYEFLNRHLLVARLGFLPPNAEDFRRLALPLTRIALDAYFICGQSQGGFVFIPDDSFFAESACPSVQRAD